jgi:nitrite reductase/ring-hydroxylating ferredoxin subunit
LLRRRRGGSGRLLSVAALTVSGAAAYLGGHLAFRQALGPNHAEHVPHRVPPGWTSIGALDELPERTLVPRTLGDQPLVAYRDGSEVTVLSDVCPHLSGPLHEGEVSDGCVTCPWHGSSFRLADGEPVAGPATAPVPAFEVRVEAGQVRVLLPGAG